MRFADRIEQLPGRIKGPGSPRRDDQAGWGRAIQFGAGEVERGLGYREGEMGWTLETNDLINHAAQVMGGRRAKTYRIYERAI